MRPGVILSSTLYHTSEPDLILGAITTNLAAATSPVDYVSTDWQSANLRFPSAFKPLLFTLEPSLIMHIVGKMSPPDLSAVERRVRLALELPFASLSELTGQTDLRHEPAAQVQMLAELAIAAMLFHANHDTPNAAPDRLRALLAGLNPEDSA